MNQRPLFLDPVVDALPLIALALLLGSQASFAAPAQDGSGEPKTTSVSKSVGNNSTKKPIKLNKKPIKLKNSSHAAKLKAAAPKQKDSGQQKAPQQKL